MVEELQAEVKHLADSRNGEVISRLMILLSSPSIPSPEAIAAAEWRYDLDGFGDGPTEILSIYRRLESES